ncbi:MAG: succinate dehydrogenase assembly factor 2 [Sulfitobacter sp.]
MSELHAHRLKRLIMRSMRRGIKEMDLILPPYAAARLDQMDEDALTLYDALLNENDHDLYQWVTGQVGAPAGYSEMIADIQAHLKTHRV